MSATLILAVALMTADATSASPPAVSENVPVPGGLAALAKALEVERLDRGTAVAELTRLAPERDKAQRLIAHLDSARRARTLGGESLPTDNVPFPLSPAIWSDAIFKRSIARDDLLAAVLSDKHASLLARGLTALDDQTLAFVASRPAMLAGLYQRNAAVFAGFAAHLRIDNGRVVSPGGDQAAALWENVVGERVSSPERFIRALLEKHEGRIAYLYDVIAHLDPARQKFALGLWLDGPARVPRFQALASAVGSAFGRWDATKTPFTRPADDLLALLIRVEVKPDGAPAAPAARSVWAAIFENGDAQQPSSSIDAAWFAETLLAERFWERSIQLDQLGFGQRLSIDADAATLPDAIYAVRALPKFRMLLLTLERIGVRNPVVHAAMVRHAERLSTLDSKHYRTALAQFQGTIAVIARLRRVGTIDVAAAEKLLARLAAVPVDPVTGYRTELAAWLDAVLLPAVRAPGREGVRETLLDALSGTLTGDSVAPVTWEGQTYSFNLAAGERLRLTRALDRNPEASIDAALGLFRSGKSHPGGPAPERVDSSLADALVVLAYAIDWSDPQGLGRLIRGTVASRHDFGLGKRMAEARVRTPWAVPMQVFNAGEPWHLEGSILGLDLPLSTLALRRVHADAPLRPPTLNEVDRDGFIGSFALMNPYELQDSTADAIADAIRRGRRRVEALNPDGKDLAEIVDEVRMDGWRARALRWSVASEPSEVGRLFSLAELLHLGGGSLSEADRWGMSSLVLLGCVCSRLASPGLQSAVIGRPQTGILSSTVADLHLRIVVTLRELGLPAALAKTVLAGALREFLDRVRPLHHDDWLTLVRAAQRVPRERIEDYVAIATAGGPLVPSDLSQRTRQ